MQLLPTVFWCDLQTNGHHLFFYKRWAPFLSRFSGILPICRFILRRFRNPTRVPRIANRVPADPNRVPNIFLKKTRYMFRDFVRILPGFSTNQNFWVWLCIPASYTTGITNNRNSKKKCFQLATTWLAHLLALGSFFNSFAGNYRRYSCANVWKYLKICLIFIYWWYLSGNTDPLASSD